MNLGFNSKKGLTLVVLVVTIIVTLIISGVIVFVSTQNAPIDSANLAKFKNNAATYKDQLAEWISNEYIATNDELDITTVNATNNYGEYKGLKITDIIPDISASDAALFEIQKGELVYVGKDIALRDVATTVGITSTSLSLSSIETFETGSPTVYSYSGTWLVSNTSPIEGTYSYRSAVIGNLGNSSTTFSVSVPSDSHDYKLQLDYRVSSEENGDFFNIYVNSVKQLSVSGTKSATYEIILPAGNNSIKLEYAKNATIASGTDSVYVDNIQLIQSDLPLPVITATAPGFNQDSTVTITYPTIAVEKKYGFNAITWADYTDTLVVSNNTTVYAKYVTASGEESKTAILLVTNVDVSAPTVAFSPNGSTQKVNIASSKVIVSDAGGSGVDSTSLKYVWDTQNTTAPTAGWTTFSNSSTLTKTSVTGVYYLWVQAKDIAGNTIVAKSNSFDIDDTLPAIPIIAANPSIWTNNNVDVTITYPSNTSSRLYSINGTTWSEYTSSLSLEYNTTVYAKCTSLSGKISETAALAISNIDKSAPTVAFNAVGGEGTASVSVTLNVADTGSGVKNSSLQYIWDTQSQIEPTTGWNTFVNNITLTKDTVTGYYYLWVKAEDNLGNAVTTKSNAYYLVQNKPSVPIIHASTQAFTNQDVTVTVTYSPGSMNHLYSLDGVTYHQYTSPVLISSNTTVYAKCYSVMGTESDIGNLVVNNIDKAAPTVAFGTNGSSNSKTGTTTVTLSDVGVSGIDSSSLKYVWDTQNTTAPTTGWASFANGSAMTISEFTGTYYLWVKGADLAGNQIPINSVSEAFSIDNTPPTSPSFTVLPNAYVNTFVTVTITYDPDSSALLRLYSLDGVTWQQYTGPFMISNEGVTVLAKCSDLAGNESSTSGVFIANIDKSLPTVSFSPNGSAGTYNASTTVTVTDVGYSGVNATTLQYVWDTQNVTQPTSGWTLFTNGATLTQSSVGTYYLWIKGSDNAGNSLPTNTVSNAFTVINLTNTPVLATGMTAKKWNSGTSTWDTVSNPSTDTSWYDYSNQMWANAQTADGSMWVWIPRYIYKITSGWHTSTAGTIAVQFTQGTNDNWNSGVIGIINPDTTANASNNTWTNHPAFTFGSTELTGFWMAKFEASGTLASIDSKPGALSIANNTINDRFTGSRNMETNSRYGWGTTGIGINTHLTKSVEWGAASYLAQSAFGRNGTEVTINSDTTSYTGGGSGTAYQTNVTQSTTGNISGIYDMSGGYWEFTASYIDNGNSNLTSYGLSLVNAGSRYKDVYSKGVTDSTADNYALAINSKGDGVYETSSQGSGYLGWFTDSSEFVNNSYTFLERSCSYSMGTAAGIFAFGRSDGSTSNNGRNFRPVLAVSSSFTDDTAPTVAFGTNGASNVKTASTTVTYSDAGCGVNTSTLQYVWDTQNTTTPLTGWATFTNGSAITKGSVDGTYYLWVRGEDNQGNSLVTKTNAFILDNTAPTITISNPSLTGAKSIDTVTYTVTYADTNFNSSTLVAGNITLNKTGTANGTAAVTGTGLTRTVTINSITGDGTLGISIAAGTASDLSGNTALAAGPSTTFTVDNTGPTAPVISANPNVWTTSDVTVTITYAGDATTKSYSTDGTNWYNYTVPITVTSNLIVYARCSDSIGNSSTTSTLTISNIDRVVPTATFGKNGGTVYPTASTTVTASDALSGINSATLNYYWDTQNTTLPTSGWTTFTNGATLTYTGTVGTTWYLWIKASDNAGNTLSGGSLVSSGFIFNDAVTVNDPVLATGMTAKKWNSGTSTWDTVADPVNDKSWYNYSSASKKWANAQTADGSMWVWVPRYIYKITSGWHSATTGAISIQYTQGTNDNWNSASIGTINTGTGASASNNTWTNNPAFTFGSTELKGIWVAKFEASGSTTAVASKPGVAALASVTMNTIFTACRNMETTNGVQYGWGTTGKGIDTHLMKNSEWGAVAYLAHSMFGRNATEVTINADATFYTGGGSGTAYQTNVAQSTTGNIYGIYDMSGGTWEYVAAYVNDGEAVLTTYSSNLTGAAAKYKDVYTGISTNTMAQNYANTANTKGDAIYETSSQATLNTDQYAWFTDKTNYCWSPNPILTRGGQITSGTGAGLFAFGENDGNVYTYQGFRPVIAVSSDAGPTSSISLSTTSWTNANITATITYSADATIKEYSTDGTTWSAYTAPITISSNTNLYARAANDFGDYGEYKSLVISNIDKNAPAVSFGTNGAQGVADGSTTVLVEDTSGSGISTIQYYWDTQNATAPTSGWVTCNNGSVITKAGLTGTHYLWVQATDVVGNVTTTVSNMFTYWAGVNRPILSQGMTAYTVSGTTWSAVASPKTDTTWYSYDTTNKKWANAQTADGSMWVWVPRFIYKIASGWHGATASAISIAFSKGTDDTVGGTYTLVNNGTASDSNNAWTSHPAFTMGTEQLTGIWVAKFQLSGTAAAPTVLPGVVPLKSLTIDALNTAVTNMETLSSFGWGTSSTSNNISTHMIKNSEWGAVAYLTQSAYGRNNTEVTQNTNSSYYNGGGTTTTYLSANTAMSTTGNGYGVYDMRGGCQEYVSAYLNNGTANLTTNGAGLLSMDNRYKDIYSIGTTDTAANNYTYAANYKGDALYEVSSGTGTNLAWFGDVSTMFATTSPFFLRGGDKTSATTTGIFAFTSSTGASSTSNGTRPVVAIVDETPPAAPVVAVSPTTWTPSVTVTINYPEDSVYKWYTIEYSSNKTMPIYSEYTVPLTVTDNSYVYACSVDAAGNTTTNIYYISNLDNSGPKFNMSSDGGYNLSTASTQIIAYDPSGVDLTSLEYAWDTYQTGTIIVNPTTYTPFKNGETLSLYGITEAKGLWIRGKDLLGNTTTYYSRKYTPAPLVANAPELIDGMIAKKWNSGTNTWDTVADPVADTSWYNYDTTNKIWGNAQTVDGSMWVWIPRFVYKINSGWHSSTTGTISVSFVEGTDDDCNNGVIGWIDKSTNANASNGKWTNHPAFTFNSDTENTGFWVAKFEATAREGVADTTAGDNVTTKNVQIVPGVKSWRNINASNIYDACAKISSDATFGWGTLGGGPETHQMKNIEWGAIAYLTQSSYGRNGTEVTINSSSTYYTGGGTGTAYYATNTAQSTTGNVYGIYDMSGGAWELVAAYDNNNDVELTTYSLSLKNAADKVKDLYTPGSPDDAVTTYGMAINKKGDALYEVSNGYNSAGGWFADYSYMIYKANGSLARGGYYSIGTGAGIFAFTTSNGATNAYLGFRPVAMSAQTVIIW